MRKLKRKLIIRLVYIRFLMVMYYKSKSKLQVGLTIDFILILLEFFKHSVSVPFKNTNFLNYSHFQGIVKIEHWTSSTNVNLII